MVRRKSGPDGPSLAMLIKSSIARSTISKGRIDEQLRETIDPTEISSFK